MASRTEILYVKGMNLSDTEVEEEVEEDIWDDSKLNDAYDKALRIANAEVAKRVAMSTNTQDSQQHSSKGVLNRKNKPSSKGKTRKNSHNSQCKVGMPCRAVYEGDGLEYEAVVVRIINDKECVVRFIGYDNSEIVPINTLKPPLGPNECAQGAEVLSDNANNGFTNLTPNFERMECGSDRVPSPETTEKSFQRKKKSSKKNKKPSITSHNGFELPEMPFAMPNIAALRNLGSMDMPLPPPPPLQLTEQVHSEDQAISSMLLSWYMSGYYTGLYQGLKRAKGGRRNV